MITLDGEIALVTGASRGIGQAIARELARWNATVIGTATTDAGAEAITQDLHHRESKGRGLRLDVTDPVAVDTAVKVVTQEFGAPTILINNAGITRDNLLLRMKEEEWLTILNTNLSSVFRLSKAVLRGMMKAQRGRIVSITSVVGATGNPGQANYAAAKAGIIGFTKSLAREIGSRNITVNAVAPGLIATDMTRELPEAQRQALIGAIPLQRLGEVQDIAHAVAFLVSPAAAYITGETLHVNGGMYMA
ncbi:MAG: 3-oxoacyl-ACP reductase FabG [Candidatus Competibacteraceae bacterium]|uniref:3-oxoacyl-[acyl-carrier-protein] reductase n=1 Tax=Candidatus Contendobacter odensis Run_B_J11 TaxID=1400861 RepID=A0A7U7G871_9GAMM|nr:3-oxoacyl-ACP reductase FabG [Candidatus Contendobacter odensis]MBK8536058.1 3-oxoacyl-ACP reductase FabG [Candidatus Competibacteraceae bacterium]MBK8750521.1 3-oxoacyl-ACP reductase FabG [Candidatus Competibacteraceae bacterium]CDH43379.1 3-oxoacyl-(acyl-carrier-protein) reductase [Candidatus Contendobacter odensis Run_B_J11]